MTTPVTPTFRTPDATDYATVAGRVVVFAAPDGRLGTAARKVDRLMRGALARAAASPAFAKLKAGEGVDLAYPAGMAAEAVHLIRLAPRDDAATMRKAGALIGARLGAGGVLVLAAGIARVADLSLGLMLRAYAFSTHKTGDQVTPGPVVIEVADLVAAEGIDVAAVAEGVFLTRDLTAEPANVLSTTEFATRLTALTALGVEVEVIDEAELERLGLRLLLAVGQGSACPSKVVVMRWQGGGAEAPLALIGKGVVFDTGGISIKPAGGMEEMTMDMGGAAVVAGVMHTLARRKARANVVGVVGLVENMPSSTAQRPGDIVRSLKGDTVEVINTDAEGRLVLADILWYAQERFAPTGVINLATLTGAIIVALGHEFAGVFSNDDAFADAFLKAAAVEGEGAWRMPLGEAFDRKLKSDLADMKNIGGRDGGAIIAAQFLQRFIKPGMPWIHLDIAGTALVGADTGMAPKGVTGWGVRALDRMIRDGYEKG